ncbi:MAG: TetR/AcrR family transcriptional regulator [Acidimicrobiia bacterium]
MTLQVAKQRGRPRSRTADHAILTAAVELLAERGFADLTMHGVARRAGVSKATIYRRYPNRQALIEAACATTADALVVRSPSGSLHDDLSVLVRELGRVSTTPAGRVVGRAAVEGRRLRSTLLHDWRCAATSVLREGIAHGEIRADWDVDFAVDVLVGTILLRRGECATERASGQLVDIVLAAAPPRRVPA